MTKNKKIKNDLYLLDYREGMYYSNVEVIEISEVEKLDMIIKGYLHFVEDESNKREGNHVPQYMRCAEQRNGILFFGTQYYGYDSNRQEYTKQCSVGKPQGVDGHVLVVGGAGSGKSSCIAIPTLGRWDGAIFAIDIKGELTANWNKKWSDKRPTKIINLTKEEGEYCSYDPFYFLRREGNEDDLVQNAREIAQAIIPIPPDTRDPFWLQSAQHILTAALLYGACLKAKDDDGNEVAATFNQTMTNIQIVPIWQLLEEIGNSGNMNAIMHINQFLEDEVLDEEEINHGIKPRKVVNYELKTSKMLAGISAELSNKVMVFATDSRIKNLFNPNGDIVKWDDLETHNIFMRIAEDKLGQWDGAITLMLTQLIRSLERRHDKTYTPDGKPIILSEHGKVISPTLLLLDEFPRLGKVDVIQNAVSILRSKGVTICLMMQSLAQLDKTYGKETRQIIVDNCVYKAILQVTDPENQKIFSDMIGTIRVGTKSVGDSANTTTSHSKGDSAVIGESSTYSSGKSIGSGGSASINVAASREPIIQPHEFATLEDIILMTPKGFCRVHKSPYYRPLKTRIDSSGNK